MDITTLAYIDATGYHLADYPSFQDYLIGVYQTIYGADVYIEPDSQDGQFLAIVSKALYDTAAMGQSIYNSFPPGGAQGVGLSRIVKINGLKRLVPSYSTATLTIVGTDGTVINNGIAADVLGQQWNLPSVVTIPGSGTIDVTATAAIVGFVTAVANSITTIFTPTLGWQTVNNVGAATPGAPVETDAALRVRQTMSTADPSLTVFDGTVGGVGNVTGVVKVKGYENDTGVTDGNGIPAHSICIVVVGGTDLDVANEIMLHKTPGTGTFGSTTVLVYDAHGMPLNIHFQRALAATIQVTITGTALVGWSVDFIPLIQQSVADFINKGAIGDTIIYTKLFIEAYLPSPQGDTYDISSIVIGKNGGGQSAANVTLLFDEDPVCVASTDVVVNIT